MDNVSELDRQARHVQQVSEKISLGNMGLVQFTTLYGDAALVSGGGLRLKRGREKMRTFGVNVSIALGAVGRGEKPYGVLVHTNRGHFQEDIVDFFAELQVAPKGTRVVAVGAAPLDKGHDWAADTWKELTDKIEEFREIRPDIEIESYKIREYNTSVSLGIDPRRNQIDAMVMKAGAPMSLAKL